jgi:hypothetical protein
MLARNAVIGAMAAAGVAVLVNLIHGDGFDTLLAAIYGAAVYVGVYSKLTTDVVTARNIAIILAAAALVFLFFAENVLFILINLVAAGCLGFAFLQLRDPDKNAAPGGPAGPGTNS